MKVAVINFSGNVGKTTVARHLLMPRMPGASLVAVETINDDQDGLSSLRGNQFGDLQDYVQTVDSVVIDIGASNVEQLLALMERYTGSHEDFDFYLVPTVSAFKQQRDTIATLTELRRLGVPADKLRVVFNMVDRTENLDRVFEPVLAFARHSRIDGANGACHIGMNEVYELVKQSPVDLKVLADDDTDYKALIAQATDTSEKLVHARRLAARRLARGVVPELDACFAALGFTALRSALAPTPAAAP